MKTRFYLAAIIFLAGTMLLRAGVSYDESAVFAFNTRDDFSGLAAESATFAFDTRLVDGLQGAAVSEVFAFDTSFASAPPLFLTGTVRDSASVPLAGTAVKLKRFETVFWQGTTVAGGTFSAPNLSPWNYTVIVTKPGYVTHISNHSGAAGGSQTLNIALQSLPAPPTAVTTNQKPPASAEIAWQIANQRGGVIGVSATLVTGAAATVATWKSPLPKSAKWVDSYISAFGLQRQDAVNVCLLKPAVFYSRINPLATLDAAHAYSHEWHLDSVTPTGIAPAISWKLSLEAGATFPPAGSGRNAGALWLENLATFDPLDQFQVPTPTNYDCNLLILSAFLAPSGARAAAQDALVATQIADATGRLVMASYETGLQLVGEAGGTVIHKSQQVFTETKEKVGQLWDAALDRAANVLDSVGPDSQLVGPLSAAVPSMQLITQPAPAPLFGARNLAGAGATNQPGYAWMTVNVPANAGLMAFDFTVTGEPADDCMACAVNGQNVFTLPARFAPDGSPVSTDMIDISAYAGQSVELFFGLVGGTSTSCAVAVDGIRFITIPQPKVGLAVSGSSVAVKWPAAAVGWVLESTDSLAQPNWLAVPVNTGVVVDSGVATLVQPVSEAIRFFRLRRNP